MLYSVIKHLPSVAVPNCHHCQKRFWQSSASTSSRVMVNLSILLRFNQQKHPLNSGLENAKHLYNERLGETYFNNKN